MNQDKLRKDFENALITAKSNGKTQFEIVLEVGFSKVTFDKFRAGGKVNDFTAHKIQTWIEKECGK